jgi:hypothetical protein
MRNVADRSFKIALYVTVVLIVAAVAITLRLQLRPPNPDRLPFLRFELDIFKAILAGFVVGMLGIFIPALASEAHHRFATRKQSRIAYSRAKTGVDYLKLRLAASTLAEAATALQRAHFAKHQAELFDDFPEWLVKRYGSKMDADQWDYMMYGKLFGARQVVERNAEHWDRLSPAQRIALLDHSLPTKSEA